MASNGPNENMLVRITNEKTTDVIFSSFRDQENWIKFGDRNLITSTIVITGYVYDFSSFTIFDGTYIVCTTSNHKTLTLFLQSNSTFSFFFLFGFVFSIPFLSVLKSDHDSRLSYTESQ